MRIAYLDCVGGISGDMFAGALLDAGWPEASLRTAVAWLGPDVADLRVERRVHHGLCGLGIVVTPSHHAHHHHHHRGLAEVARILDEAPLDPQVRRRARAVFERLAEAEGRAHGVAPNEVHFHEVGAVDALVDVVAACQGLHDLAIARLHVSAVPLGRGLIEASHGQIPLPAPAAAHLLAGAPVRWDGGEGERTTPTGAALVAELGTWDPPPPMTLECVGTGAGSRTMPDAPNVARLFVGRARPGTGSLEALSDRPAWGWGVDDEAPGRWGEIVCLEALIDDAPGEALAHAAELLRAAGALDVILSSEIMKKGRPGCRITVIARPAEEPALVGLLLRETPTAGVRRRREWRRELERRAGSVETPYGPIAVKWTLRADGWDGKPEYEACRSAAERAGVPLAAVRAAAREAAARPSLQ